MFKAVMLLALCGLVSGCATAGDRVSPGTVTTMRDGWVCDATGCHVPKSEQAPRPVRLPDLR